MTISNTTKEYVPYTKEINVNVKEVKAPTDESVSLLNQLQEKAKENIIKSVKVEENHLNGIIVAFVNDMMGGIKIMMKFNLNGKEYIFEEILSYLDSRNLLSDESIMYKKIYQKFSEVIVNELMKQSDFLKDFRKI